MGGGDVVFNDKAYCKLILHAAKYPHCAVNGVLLAETSKLKAKTLVFVDVIPLFHIQLNLTPMAEIALTQIDHWAAGKGLSIAGYYIAHENMKENSFEKAYCRIADKIADNNNSACLVVVDNRKLSLHLDNIALRVAQFSDGKYRPVDSQKVSVEPTCVLEACASMLQRQEYKQLIDFDNHLDDISMDWSNQQLNKDITEILKLCGSLC